jgi:hypothetical protein
VPPLSAQYELWTCMAVLIEFSAVVVHCQMRQEREQRRDVLDALCVAFEE